MASRSEAALTRARPRSVVRRELRSLARQGRLILTRRARRGARLSGERVVVFVHGFMATGAVFDPMRAHVERELGVPTTRLTWSPLSPFPHIVRALERHVAEHVEDGARLALVGHSMGGLVARWFLQEHGAHERVDRLITVATPHGGTDKARWAPRHLAAALLPTGPVVTRLSDHAHVAARVRHVAVVAGDDHLSPPHSAAAITGEVVHLDGVGHNEALFDPRVWDVVVSALRGG